MAKHEEALAWKYYKEEKSYISKWVNQILLFKSSWDSLFYKNIIKTV